MQFDTENGRGRAAIRWIANGGYEAEFQYRERSWEGCNSNPGIGVIKKWSCFNTENGRGRAAIPYLKDKIFELDGFQYRERSWEGCKLCP